MTDTRTRSTSELVMDITDDLRKLLRKEIELARIEFLDGLKAQFIGAGMIALAAVSLLPALLFFLFALTFWLPWSNQVSFLFTGGVLLVLVAVMIGIGVGIMKRRRPKLERSVASIKEDVRWAREQMTS
jgi:uncharacterized membrane protein YqjE